MAFVVMVVRNVMNIAPTLLLQLFLAAEYLVKREEVAIMFLLD